MSKVKIDAQFFFNRWTYQKAEDLGGTSYVGQVLISLFCFHSSKEARSYYIREKYSPYLWNDLVFWSCPIFLMVSRLIQIATYSGAGYTQNLHQSLNMTQAILAELQQGKWITQGTRYQLLGNSFKNLKSISTAFMKKSKPRFLT